MDSTTVGFRLKSDVWARYSAEAEAAGVSLATHLRRRLEQQDGVTAELALLRSVVERGPGSRTATSHELSLPPGGLLEMLLLLRVLAGPQKATIAQKEVERRGLEIWR
jgi:hypothetical protein